MLFTKILSGKAHNWLISLSLSKQNISFLALQNPMSERHNEVFGVLAVVVSKGSTWPLASQGVRKCVSSALRWVVSWQWSSVILMFFKPFFFFPKHIQPLISPVCFTKMQNIQWIMEPLLLSMTWSGISCFGKLVCHFVCLFVTFLLINIKAKR